MRILLSALALLISVNAMAERIISKEDADRIFSLDQAGWIHYVERMTFPKGWTARTQRTSAGISVMAFDRNTGYGLSIQPMYLGLKGPPEMLIVGSYYPQGTLGRIDKAFMDGVKREAEKDLVETYAISVTRANMPPFEGIELLITRKTK